MMMYYNGPVPGDGEYMIFPSNLRPNPDAIRGVSIGMGIDGTPQSYVYIGDGLIVGFKYYDMLKRFFDMSREDLVGTDAYMPNFAMHLKQELQLAPFDPSLVLPYDPYERGLDFSDYSG
jgi:hypothetical protein